MSVFATRAGALLLVLGRTPARPASAQIRIEAESGTVSDPTPGDTEPGAEVRTSDSNVSGALTGTGFVALQKGALTLRLAGVPAGTYTLSVAYTSPFGTKYEYVDADGVRYGNSVECTETFGSPQVTTWTALSLADTASPAVAVSGQASSTLAERSHVRLDVYDVTGRRVAPLVDEVQAEGPHTARFDASGLGSGVYLARLQTPAGVQTRRTVQVR